MSRIIKASPTINKADLADLCGVSLDVIKYNLKILRTETGLHWEGHSLNGRWVFGEEKD